MAEHTSIKKRLVFTSAVGKQSSGGRQRDSSRLLEPCGTLPAILGRSLDAFFTACVELLWQWVLRKISLVESNGICWCTRNA